jgi:hypothetical protein
MLVSAWTESVSQAVDPGLTFPCALDRLFWSYVALGRLCGQRSAGLLTLGICGSILMPDSDYGSSEGGEYATRDD